MSSGAADTQLYRTMLLIRRFEEAVNDLFLRGEVYGSTHLCIGQEAVSAGVASVMGERDDEVSCERPAHTAARSSRLSSVISSRRRAASSNRRLVAASCISSCSVWISRPRSSGGTSARSKTADRCG